MSRKPDDLEEDDIPEMDLSGGVRGKYYDRYIKGSNVVLLEPDLAKVFRNSAVVNRALREYLTEREGSNEADQNPSAAVTSSEARLSSDQHWQIAATPMFWDSLTQLEDTPAVASALMTLLEHLARDPELAPVASETHVRIVGTAETLIESHVVPPLRLAYTLSEQQRSIELVAVYAAESAAEMPVKIAAQVERFLRRAG